MFSLKILITSILLHSQHTHGTPFVCTGIQYKLAKRKLVSTLKELFLKNPLHSLAFPQKHL